MFVYACTYACICVNLCVCVCEHLTCHSSMCRIPAHLKHPGANPKTTVDTNWQSNVSFKPGFRQPGANVMRIWQQSGRNIWCVQAGPAQIQRFRWLHTHRRGQVQLEDGFAPARRKHAHRFAPCRRKPIFLLTLPYLATVSLDLRRAGANAPDVLAYRYCQTATEFGLTIFLSSVHAPIFTVLGLHPVSACVFTLRQFSVGPPLNLPVLSQASPVQRGCTRTVWFSDRALFTQRVKWLDKTACMCACPQFFFTRATRKLPLALVFSCILVGCVPHPFGHWFRPNKIEKLHTPQVRAHSA